MRRRCGSALYSCGLLVVTASALAQPAPELRIQGVEGALLENLQAYLALPEESCSAPLPRLRRSLPELEQAAVTALNGLGYYHATVALNFAVEADCWYLNANVSPGEPLRYRQVDLRIAGDEEVQRHFEPQVRAARLRPGAVLDHVTYEALKTALGAQATELGYFAAAFDESVIALDLPAHAADLTLHFNPGPRYRFGELRVANPGILSDELIRDMLPLEEGQLYTAAGLAELRGNLDRSQYFSRIRVTPLIREAQNNTVPVDIQLGLRPRHAWTSGLGFTTDTGPRARFSYENRFLNSRGHRLQASSSLSSIRAELGGSYTVPLNHPLADSAIFSAQYIVENDDVYKSKRLQTGISLPTENRWGWQQTLSLNLQRDDYEFTNSEDVSLLVLPGLSLSKSRADDFINPLDGWKLLASVQGASESLLSDNTFLQFYGSAKWIKGFGRFRLLTRGELGATWIDQNGELPASLRYYAGGDQSVRGYDFRAIGPQDEEGNAQGGRQLAVASFEVDYRIRDKWRLALFTDAGSAFDNRGDLDPVYSAGIGLRWLSPIGPLRIDLAHPINADESFRIHVTMGPDL